MIPKHPSESLTILTDLVLPSETNPLNNLFGGELLARMDRAASIAARRHSRRIVVTASVNHVAFNRAVPIGSVVTIEAKISRSFKSSMEIYIDVWIEDRESGRRAAVAGHGLSPFQHEHPQHFPHQVRVASIRSRRAEGADGRWPQARQSPRAPWPVCPLPRRARSGRFAARGSQDQAARLIFSLVPADE